VTPLRRHVVAHAVAVALAACAVVPAAAEPRAAPASFAGALSRGMPLAVGVYGIGTPQRNCADGAPVHDELSDSRVGAGFLIDAQGLVVTAAHVVTGCDRVAVKLADQRVVLAQKIGEDEDTDIALLRLSVSLPVSPAFGRTAALRAGDWVLAVGEPYGLNRSVSAGIVGGKDRHFAEGSDLLYIQSDLALNPGNSGGPLLDSSGAIVGMNIRTVVGAYGTPGVSLSIPIEIVLQIAHELKTGGPITRPRLGAEFCDVTPAVALARGRSYTHGALIELVRSGSLAGRAGLRVGDIVVGMNGRPIEHSAAFARALLRWHRAEGTLFTVYRNGGYRQLTLE
jgi:S1-C subfamily serine protease